MGAGETRKRHIHVGRFPARNSPYYGEFAFYIGVFGFGNLEIAYVSVCATRFGVVAMFDQGIRYDECRVPKVQIQWAPVSVLAEEDLHHFH